MHILGVNAFHGDSSAAIFSNGKLVAAFEEERFNRIKHWAGFPALAARECLKYADGEPLGHVAVSRNPRSHFWRKLGWAAIQPNAWARMWSRAQNSFRAASLERELSIA